MPDKTSASVTKCSSCRQEMLEGLLFCTGCGKALADTKHILKTGGRPCPHCQTVDNLSFEFCISCGTAMEEPEAKAAGTALAHRQPMNWRSQKESQAQPKIKSTSVAAPRSHFESVLRPTWLGVAAGLCLTVMVFALGEQSLRYQLARAASPRKGMVMFVRLGDESNGAAGMFKRQAKVRVTLTQSGKQISATTDGYGMLVLPALSPDRYEVRLSADGYETAVGRVTVHDGPTIVGWPEPLTLSPLKDG